MVQCGVTGTRRTTGYSPTPDTPDAERDEHSGQDEPQEFRNIGSPQGPNC